MTVRRCPECDAKRRADGGPGCDCAAGEVARAADYTPLLLRPYVKPAEPDAAGRAEPSAPARGTASATLDPAADRGGAKPAGAAAEADGGGGEDTGGAGAGRGAGSEAAEDSAPRRRRRTGMLVVAAASLLAVPVALFGAISIAEDAFDHAGPQRPPGPPGLTLPTGPGHPGLIPSQDPAETPPGRHTGGGARPSATAPGVSNAPAGGGRPTPPDDAVSAPPPPDDAASPGADAAPVLRQGSTGPEVVLLQKRLRAVGGLYQDRPDGVYDAGVAEAVATFQRWRAVTGDPAGVYGPYSREQLESETPRVD